MKRKLSRILAGILCISMMVTSIPTVANAKQVIDVIPNITSIENEVEAVVVTELEHKRTADTKTFLMSDGSYLQAIYPEQVHYRENNEWVDIDNSFDTTKDDDGSEVLENKKKTHPRRSILQASAKH